MKTSDSLVLPPSPSLITALRVGFDAIANHITLILFPVILDVLLWLGPRLRLKELFNAFYNQLANFYPLGDAGTNELMQVMQEAWALAAEQFNLFAVLRSYPIGVPSLFVSRLPIETPLGAPPLWEIRSLGSALIAWCLLSIAGIVIGTLYFSIVARASLSGTVSWGEVFGQWPRAALQMLFLSLLWVALLLIASVPGSFIISLAVLGGSFFGQCALFAFVALLFWLIFPLIFSPHGILVQGYSIFPSIRASVILTRKTVVSTSLFLLAAFLISQGLNILWLVPSETSWLIVVGVIGHAFVTTGLVAASFVYYRDALNWVQGVLPQKL